MSLSFSIRKSNLFSNAVRNSVLPSPSVNTIETGSKDVILVFVMGQSNARGSGENTALSFTSTNVFCLPLDGTTFIEFDSTDRAFSYSLGGTNNLKYSPAYALALNWQTRIDNGETLSDLYIVTVALGGSGLDPSLDLVSRAWANNGFLPDKSVEAFQVALRALTVLGKRVYFAGTWWLQGEKDAQTTLPSDNYLSNFMGLYQLWKNTISVDHFIWFVELTKIEDIGMSTVNQAYSDFTVSAQPHAGAYVFDLENSGINPFKVDSVHFNAAALDWMANIISNQITSFTSKELKLIANPTVTSPLPVPLTFTAANYPVSTPLRIQGLSTAGDSPWAHNIALNASSQKYIEAEHGTGSDLSFLKPDLPSDMIDGQVEFSFPAGAPTGIGAAFRVQSFNAGYKRTNFSYLAILVDGTGNISLASVPLIGGALTIIASLGAILTWPGSAFRARFKLTGSFSTTGGYLFEGEVSTDNFQTVSDSFSSNHTSEITPPSGRANFETGGLGIVYGLLATIQEVATVELFETIFSVTK